MSSHAKELFVPVKTLECTITTDFLVVKENKLEENKLEGAALGEVDNNPHRWPPLVDSLTKQFCTWLPLKEEYQ
ncbi:hypothetical protein Pmar_PMAR028890 [Perkinsus marinus ATCC 50983]|uniref:Uncharacterized protein n=1 Tax=Perkinsus marinus (strain ATCC 50983 / TXsc) TaxID=423536 RepID=C5L8G7_PERM5|nr:hypothetical protein Pmar_PMAR028890 [Perkinsus marinus ATCC 50983]EER06987.1 hypothetical protein Pmar_PMAR028890 [Perkinsus marinus ATCC 50983]|eukprot:XP_002775171.1 hypothetical protein Pmar_PMAR028890 [Perkinsus marinus ATCC 50983]